MPEEFQRLLTEWNQLQNRAKTHKDIEKNEEVCSDIFFLFLTDLGTLLVFYTILKTGIPEKKWKLLIKQHSSIKVLTQASLYQTESAL